jgi:tRNA threonylcarbamoyladenosine biosynthesis protein TsaB
MLVLGVDTSGREGGITLARGEGGQFSEVESTAIQGGTFSAQLVPQIVNTLQRHNLDKTKIEGFAAVLGPGSFTGLRIGLAAVKALAEVLQKPIAVVSTLEMLALASQVQGKVLAALDAGRKEVFVGIYETKADSAKRISERLLTQAEFISEAKSFCRAGALVACEATVAEVAHSAGAPCELVLRPGSAAATRICMKKLLAGETVPVEELDANYIRRTDAELLVKPNP